MCGQEQETPSTVSPGRQTASTAVRNSLAYGIAHVIPKVEQPDSGKGASVRVDARHEAFLDHVSSGKLSLN